MNIPNRITSKIIEDSTYLSTAQDVTPISIDLGIWELWKFYCSHINSHLCDISGRKEIPAKLHAVLKWYQIEDYNY